MIAGTGEGYGGSELDLRRASGEAGEARSSKALRAVCEALGRSHARAWRSRRRKSASDLRWPTAMTAPQVWRKPRSSSQIFRGMPQEATAGQNQQTKELRCVLALMELP